MQEDELVGVRWMPLEEYTRQASGRGAQAGWQPPAALRMAGRSGAAHRTQPPAPPARCSIPFTATRPLFRKLHAMCTAYADGAYQGLQGRKMEAGWGSRSDLLLFGEAAEAASAAERGDEDTWLGLGGSGPGGG